MSLILTIFVGLLVGVVHQQGHAARELVEADLLGQWQRRGVIHDFGDGHGGDGMVLDVAGNIYLTAGSGDRAGIYIFAPDGTQLGFIATGEIPGNCTFGGPDLCTLYIAASSSLYGIHLAIPGYLAYPPRD